MKIGRWTIGREARASFKDDHFWQSLFLSLKSKTNQNVTPDSSLKVSAVYACIKVLSETIASLPLILYKSEKDSKQRATEHSLYSILHDLPNNRNTAYELIEFMVACLNLRGNAYAFIERDGANTIVGIYPLNPSAMQVIMKEGKVTYSYTHVDGTQQAFKENEIWHIRGLSSDGLCGLSPIALACEPIGMAMAAEELGAKFFANDASPTGIIEYPGNLTEEQRKALRDSWQANQTNDNKYKVALLTGGMKWQAVGLNNRDSQFLETRQFQVEEIARIFRVPCILIGHSNNNSTYASAEQFMLSFVTHTVRPWLVRIEQSIIRDLLNDKERKKYKAEFKLDALLRGDTLSRYQAYQIARNWGWLSVNDIRALENLNPVDNGDIYLEPLNMKEAGATVTLPEPVKVIEEPIMEPKKETPKEEKQLTNININATAKTVRKSVTFERDEETGEIIKADIVEQREDD